MVNKVFLGIISAIVIVAFLFVVTEMIIIPSKGFIAQDSYMDFQTCIRQKEVVLYINTNNPSQILGNLQVVSSLNHIKIKNCYNAKSECDSLGLSKFPSWIINGQKVEGDINEDILAKYSGCKNK
jgi:hypothetical protein